MEMYNRVENEIKMKKNTVQMSSQELTVADDRMVLEKMRSNSFLTDFTIIASDDVRLPAHRALLACSSDFFHALFRNKGDIDEVSLPSLSEKSIVKCLEIAYVGNTSLNGEEVEDFLMAATFLQMNRAIQIAETTLCSSISSHNMESIYSIADRFSLYKTAEELGRYIEKRLARLARKKSSLRRISYQQMLKLMDSDNLDLPEGDLLLIIMKWIVACELVDNKAVVSSLLEKVRLMLIDHDALVALLPISVDLLVCNGSPLFGRVYEALHYLSKPSIQPTIYSVQNKIRARRRVTLRVAGKSLMTNNEETMQRDIVEFDNDEPATAELLTLLPTHPVSHHQVVVVNSFIFIIGGTKSTFYLLWHVRIG